MKRAGETVGVESQERGIRFPLLPTRGRVEPPRPEDRPFIEATFDHGQGHVFAFWETLSDASRQRLIDQLKTIDFGLLAHFQELLRTGGHRPTMDHLTPAPYVPLPESPEDRDERQEARRVGEEAIRQGRVGVFLVAGGQGTRLGFPGPKGCYPIGRMTGKSLFEMHAEKILAASRVYRVQIPWYVMTSPDNDAATRAFFEAHGFFGLDPEAVRFIPQRMLPALDHEGRLILDAVDHIFMSPNGHGGAFWAMADGGVLGDARHRGVDILSYFQVDNVLIRIIDPVFIGYHLSFRSQMSSKMVLKRDPTEKLGHFGMIDGRLHVIEYSDMRPEDTTARFPGGRLKFEAGSIGIHLLDPEFVTRLIQEGLRLPYHIAHKKIPFVDSEGQRVDPEAPNGYKFETFLFDALPRAERFLILQVRREEEFSPVKNRYGEDSPETARQALTDFFATWLEAVGFTIPRDQEGHVPGVIEISPLYAIDREAFLKRPPQTVFVPVMILSAPTEEGSSSSSLVQKDTSHASRG